MRQQKYNIKKQKTHKQIFCVNSGCSQATYINVSNIYGIGVTSLANANITDFDYIFVGGPGSLNNAVLKSGHRNKTVYIDINATIGQPTDIFCQETDICYINCQSEFACTNINLYCSSSVVNCFIHCDMFGTNSDANNCPDSLIVVGYWQLTTTTTTTTTSTTTTTATPSMAPSKYPSLIPSINPTTPEIDTSTNNPISTSNVLSTTTTTPSFKTTNGISVDTTTGTTASERTQNKDEEEEEENNAATMIGELSPTASTVLIICVIIVTLSIGLIIGVTVHCYHKKTGYFTNTLFALKEEEQRQRLNSLTSLNSQISAPKSIHAKDGVGTNLIVPNTKNVNIGDENVDDNGDTDDDDDENTNNIMNKIVAVNLQSLDTYTDTDSTFTKSKSRSKTKTRTKTKQDKQNKQNKQQLGAQRLSLHVSKESEMDDQMAEELYSNPNHDTPYTWETQPGQDHDHDNQQLQNSLRHDTVITNDGEPEFEHESQIVEMTDVNHEALENDVVVHQPPIHQQSSRNEGVHKSVGL